MRPCVIKKIIPCSKAKHTHKTASTKQPPYIAEEIFSSATVNRIQSVNIYFCHVSNTISYVASPSWCFLFSNHLVNTTLRWTSLIHSTRVSNVLSRGKFDTTTWRTFHFLKNFLLPIILPILYCSFCKRQEMNWNVTHAYIRV